jgi:hypothetical protein
MDRDDATAAAERRRRMAWRLRAGRARAPASVALVRYAVVASLGLVAAAGWAGRGPGAWLLRAAGVRAEPEAKRVEPPPVSRAKPSQSAGAARAAHGATESTELEASSASDEVGVPLVAMAPCFDCSRAGSDAPSVAPGESFVPGERVHVPVGSTLVLGRSADAWRVDVPGPATAVVTSRGDVETLPPERAGAPEVPARRELKDDAELEWYRAQGAIREGDRAGAERRLRRAMAIAPAFSRLWERACFALAELELARGATAAGRARLAQLRRSADDALVADAVFLEARAAASPRERADLYARYLAGDPPSPYRERAAVDEARALLDAGDIAGARARVAGLRAGSRLPDVAAVALAPLERELAAREAATRGSESTGAGP